MPNKPTYNRMTGQQHLAPAKETTEIQAIRAKLIEGVFPRDPTNTYNMPQPGVLEKIAQKTTTNINDATNILEILPDIELAMQIMTCSILSPKDLVTVELTYSCEPTDVPPELVSNMLERISNYFDSSYKIKNILPTIVEEALFTKGAYPLAVLPESSIDDIINSDRTLSTESLSLTFVDNMKPLGILGPSNSRIESFHSQQSETVQSIGIEGNYFQQAPTAENLFDEDLVDYVKITDNPTILKMPFVKTKLTSERVFGAYQNLRSTASLENANLTPEQKDQVRKHLDVGNRYYINRNYKQETIVPIHNPLNASRVPVGHPLVMKLPAECVIPVHVPANPQQHVGYFVLLDEYGNPLARARDSEYYGQMTQNASNYAGAGNFAGGMTTAGALGQITKNLQWGNCQLDTHSMNEMTRSWENIVEQALNERLRNGAYGDSVEVAKPQDIYRIMLARALAKKYTRVLYYPIEQLTYIAFDYNQFGVGRSLLDKTKILSMIRAMLLFANTMAAIKSSVSGLKATIDIDEYDPNPDQTLELMQDQIVKATQVRWPSAQGGPQDILDYLNASSIVYDINGHGKLPDIKLDFSEHKIERSGPDETMEDSLRKRHLMGLGVSPEIVDATSEVEFAATILSSNLLHAKKAMMYQDILCGFLADFVTKYALSSGSLMAELILVVTEFLEHDTRPKEEQMEVREIISVFLGSLKVTLPQPDSTKIESQVTAYEQYKAAVELMIEDTIRPDLFGETLGDKTSETMQVVIDNITAYLVRKWRQEKGIMPEIDILTSKGEGGEVELNFMKEHLAHNAALMESLGDYIRAIKKVQDETAEAAAAAEALETGEEPETYEGATSSEPSSTDDNAGGDDDLDSDLGMDTDLDLGDDDVTGASTSQTNDGDELDDIPGF